MLSHFVLIDLYQHRRSSCFVFDFAKLNLWQRVFTLNFSSVHVNISYFCNLHMWINTITHVPYCPCTPLAMCPITSVYHLDLCIIICPYAPSPMFPIAHVCHLDLLIIMPICPITHCPCSPLPMCPSALSPSRFTHYYVHVPHCPRGQG